MSQFFSRLRDKLARTGPALNPSRWWAGEVIRDSDLETLETLLLQADVGVHATQMLVDEVREQGHRGTDMTRLSQGLQSRIVDWLKPSEGNLVVQGATTPFVIMVTGVNGGGKTTTLGKLAHRYRRQGLSVMLAAADTFRAAAIEQLQAWGKKEEVAVIAHAGGNDPAAVAYDAYQAARARRTDVLLIDTAGRLHTQNHLMAELAKIRRVLGRQDPESPHETLLILDATIGQNAIAQAVQFHRAVNVTGLVITKLDGTAKGGVVIPIVRELQLPIRFLGIGESVDDLIPFNAEDFAAMLLGLEESSTV